MELCNKDREKSGFARVIVILLAVIGLMTAAAVAADFLYRKYKKYLASLNEEDSLDGVGDDCFEETGEDDPCEVDCEFAE